MVVVLNKFNGVDEEELSEAIDYLNNVIPDVEFQSFKVDSFLKKRYLRIVIITRAMKSLSLH